MYWEPTIWGLHIRHVRVVSQLSRKQTDSRRTAYRSRAVMFLEVGAFISKLLLQNWLIIKRIQMKILVISQDENDIRAFGISSCRQ